MRHTVTLLLLSVLFGNSGAKAQFHAMPTGASEWFVSFWIGPGTPWQGWTEGYEALDVDTVINGVGYTLLAGTPIRDDLAGKVFAIEPGTEVERVLYDFTALPGDTIFNMHSNLWPGVDQVVVSVDTMIINGESRRRMGVAVVDMGSSGPENYWIQGIGSLAGPLQPCVCPSVSGMTYLVCMTEDGIGQFGAGVGSPYDCSVHMSIEDPGPPKHTLQLRSEGGGRVRLVVSPGNSADAEVVIHDQAGRLLQQHRFPEDGLLSAAGWPHGIYLFTVLQDGVVMGHARWVHVGE